MSIKPVLLANAASCIIFGVLFLIMPANIADFLSKDASVPSIFLMALGGILTFNGLHLIWASKQDNLHKLWILYFSLGDLLWVLGTIILVALQLWITSSNGVFAATLVAIMVGIFGALQITNLLKK